MLLFIVVLLSVSCRTAAPVTPVIAPVPLKIAIYPVANASTIAARLQQEFQALVPYPVIVTVADMDGLYDVPTLTKWLVEGTYDIVEADMIMLQAVQQAIQQSGNQLPVWNDPPRFAEWAAAPKAASTLNGAVYGIPHYGCGYFLFTANPALSNIANSQTFLQALNNLPQKKQYLIATNVAGGTTTGAIYLNAWNATKGNLDGAMNPPFSDPAVIATMKGITTACLPNQQGNASPCLNGTFKDNNADRQAFIDGNANTYMGFSESLQAIRTANPDTQYFVTAAPLGTGQPALMYTDSLLRRVGCDAATPCGLAAYAFATYYLAPTTYQWLLLGQDVPNNQIPRYLIPATTTGWPGGDPYYNSIQTAVTNWAAFPNQTYYAQRKDMQSAITPLITP
jgi:thiamine pyridinylase